MPEHKHCEYCTPTCEFDDQLRDLLNEHAFTGETRKEAIDDLKKIAESLAFHMSTVESMLKSLHDGPDEKEVQEARDKQIARGVAHDKHHQDDHVRHSGGFNQ